MKRARRWFWTLVVIAAMAMGALSTALTASAGPIAGAAVAVSSIVLVISAALALRILVRIEPSRRTEEG